MYDGEIPLETVNIQEVEVIDDSQDGINPDIATIDFELVNEQQY